jgi:hypothetical protein
MRLRGFSVLALALGVWGLLGTSLAYGQKEYHGADSVFEMQGVVILWAILKGTDEDHSWVYIKIINSGVPPSAWQSYGVQAVDPFSNEKEWVAKGIKLEREGLIKATRSSFKEKSGRRIIFYGKTGDDTQDKPAMAVFYTSIPDTTPEFLTETQLEDYFAKAMERLKKR